jgi:hypothetical protein
MRNTSKSKNTYENILTGINKEVSEDGQKISPTISSLALQ